MKNPFKRKQPDVAAQIKAEVEAALGQFKANASAADTQTIRDRIAAVVSGGYDYADTLHNIYLDFGYPASLDFFNYWNMYRRFGIAGNVVELPTSIGWKDTPELEASDRFSREFDRLSKRVKFWNRLKGLDTRQRVGRYAGLFMRVRDNKSPEQPIEGTLNGEAALVQMVPLYEGQLKVLDTDDDPRSDTYGLPTMFQFSGGDAGDRNEDTNSSFNIHPSRVIIAAEGADNGGIYGMSSLEKPYNSLMDLRKIIGGGGEGFYKNAAQSVVFELKDGASAANNADLLTAFNDEFDAFSRDRSRRAMWAPGMQAKTLDSNLANPKDFFFNALYDVAASCQIPATIIIGQQTGRLASSEDSRHFLSMLNSRRGGSDEGGFQTELVHDVLDWCMKYGILPKEDVEIEWPDLLAASDTEKLERSEKMASINKDQYSSGGSSPFTGDEIREAAGYEPEELEDDMGEELPPVEPEDAE